MTAYIFAGCRAAAGGEISVSLEKPLSAGTIEFVLFDSANEFGDNRDAVKRIRYEARADNRYLISDVPAGEYALLVYHDENVNSQMDRNFIGIPKEPIAYANGYRPKGPPSFKKASFMVEDNADLHFDVYLEKPLGEFGRLGVGAGVIGRSSPYRDYSGEVYQVIPAVTYMGERLQLYGPEAKLGLFGSDKLRLAAVGRYRMAVYDEEDSPFLEGMGEPESTFMAGLEIIAELPGGVDISAGYSHDALDRIGGGSFGLEIDKTFQAGIMRCTPGLGMNRMSSELADNDFGVPEDRAAPERPAYEVGDTTGIEGSISIFLEFKRGWLIILDVGVELLDDDITDSPIVSEDHVVKGSGIITYVF